MSTTDRQPLDGVSVGILVAQEGTEEVEFTEPKETVSDAGADVVDNRELTSYASLRTEVENAGGEWTDQEVVVGDGVVTSRNPDDLDAFMDAIVEEFAAASE
ncbi:DJ-1/PfpI family protein [Natrinema versiforme]|uniref:DJ-1/PfpI domain-containing protein n=1 Tax=Natrinema versiforme TaxID=88724 RepID=A0A4P8WSP8_9EURY|nr:DJ-1/PfpI family protein [Natrinema versiforme]QCS45071.1 hypothetical protein FEJ81_22710 [Natrinema versiforme]